MWWLTAWCDPSPDTSGRHKQEAALFAEMEEVAKAVQPDQVVSEIVKEGEKECVLRVC